MAKARHLPKAPIREAVLDIRIPEAEAVTADRLREALLSVGEFSDIHELRRGSIRIQFSWEGPAEAQAEGGDPFGIRATTEDGLYVVQFRKDGFAFSHLPPYTDWDDFVATARPYAEAYLGVVGPHHLDRLALRYINHFRLPYPCDLDDYFVGLQRIPESLPQYMSNLLTRFTLHDPNTDFSANVTLGLLDDLDPELIGFILDIDAYRTTDFEPDLQKAIGTFQQLREFKNAIFFDLITEHNAEQYE